VEYRKINKKGTPKFHQELFGHQRGQQLPEGNLTSQIAREVNSGHFGQQASRQMVIFICLYSISLLTSSAEKNCLQHMHDIPHAAEQNQSA
jgi:hypothetical protein